MLCGVNKLVKTRFRIFRRAAERWWRCESALKQRGARSDVLLAMDITITIFRDVDPVYSDRYQSF
jgi:hypothetical protein